MLGMFVSCSMNQEPRVPVFSENYPEYVRTLASDSFMGRAPATQGGARTVSYLEEEFERVGLLPANGDSHRQAVPLVEITGSNFSPLQVISQTDTMSFAYQEDMMVTTPLLDDISVEKREMVFCGFGIVAPEYDWNDYEGFDVKDKIVVVLVNDPGYEKEDSTFFKGRAMTYYGRWTYKYEEAARQGAAGVLIVHETDAAGYGWEVVANSWSGPQYALHELHEDHQLLIQGWLHHNAAALITERAGFPLPHLKRLAAQREFQPISLGLAASVSFDVDHKVEESYNVAGYVRGSEYPEETVLYIAHWDHLGAKQTEQGLEIYHGAVDNATGTAALIALGSKFAQMQPPPARSVLFVAVTAEESGLIGSQYFAQNPLFPLDKMAGGINIDAMNIYGPTNDVAVVGYQTSEMQEYFQEHAREQGRELRPERYPERGSFYRSDHFNLMRQGVPMFYASGGDDFVGKDSEYASWVEEDQARRYHSPEDIVHEDWNWEGIYQDLWLYFSVGKDLANSHQWPQWYENTEFRETRRQTEQSRQ